MNEIKNGAIFIADCHESENRGDFWEFLSLLEKGEIKTTQLFLMGDIFDLLVGEVKYSHKFAIKYIQKLEKLALKMDIFYFEGNHDFNLARFFKNVKVFSYKMQPQIFQNQNGNVVLSHGDIKNGLIYECFTYLIRNNFVLRFLNFIDNIFSNAISKNILNFLARKDISRKIDNFDLLMTKRIQKNKSNDVVAILEGHYHQNNSFCHENILYKNFSSFACEGSYFRVECAPSMKITQQNLRGKNVNRS